MLQLLFYLFIAVVLIQLFYYALFLVCFSLKKENTVTHKQLKISVIICARNEEAQIKKNLPYIINQNYENFEIVLINDASTDKTLKIFESFKAKHKNITIVDVKPNEAFWANKKYALTLGIKASKHDFLVFTDADCKPNSSDWLKTISAHFSNSKSIVLGYGGYAKTKGSFLNKLIRYETVLTALQYFSWANLGMPYMGVGRNMAYRKELFFNNAGFKNHMQLRSGDDDLFINEVATKTNTSVCVSPESFTVSTPKTTFKAWRLQKRRHISTARHYKKKHQIVLGLFYVTQLMFWLLAIILLISTLHFKLVLLLISLRIIIQLLSVGLASKKLKELDIVAILPFLEIFLVIFQFVIFCNNLMSKPKYWK
ncbi:MAG: glycosyltransferase [Winogradskyella sp.]|nr:glycosyltransferase [Winogradskyella sp.]MBT8376575.1 glycosyltransferase [Bacteroidia bacterium]NNF85525.1 glycosyltransferase [Winogradskyella sp.]NNK39145.1 glycosyltransferase [Winogradskyella sp.]NNL81803.1 glycosyltransferase [Winogradskyella sp.]